MMKTITRVDLRDHSKIVSCVLQLSFEFSRPSEEFEREERELMLHLRTL